jgi:hypothetical protein
MLDLKLEDPQALMKYQGGVYGYIKRELSLLELQSLEDLYKKALFNEAKSKKITQTRVMEKQKKGTHKKQSSKDKEQEEELQCCLIQE